MRPGIEATTYRVTGFTFLTSPTHFSMLCQCFCKMKRAIVIVALFLVGCHAQYQPNWDSIDSRPLPSWYDQAKFGIFMHWGVYSVPSYGGGQDGAHAAGEWFWNDWKSNQTWAVNFMKRTRLPSFTYPDFAPEFKAEFFQPDDWADLFKAAGAQYVVLTSKHHEGWTNWPSKTSWNWNAMDEGPHMDLVDALAKSIRSRTAIHFGLYFSLFEWFNPLYLSDKQNKFATRDYVEEVCRPQLEEIVNTYMPEVIWSDGDWEAPYTYWNSTGFLAWLYNNSPVKDTVVVNDRWGSGMACHHGGYFTCSDRYSPGVLQKHKWENAMTVDKYSWGHRREATMADMLSPSELITQLVITVSCGGNMLMNVGPTHDGRIIPIFEERLMQMGSWLKTNGEAIYNTTHWAYQNDTVNSDVWYTYRPDTKAVYGTLLKFPNDYKMTLGAVKTSSSTKISLLGAGEVKWSTSGATVVITFPYLPLNTPLQWAWSFKFENISPT